METSTCGHRSTASLVWVAPNVHETHHSRQVSETNSNYANLLTLYDRLPGTYTPAARAEKVVYAATHSDSLTCEGRLP